MTGEHLYLLGKVFFIVSIPVSININFSLTGNNIYQDSYIEAIYLPTHTVLSVYTEQIKYNT